MPSAEICVIKYNNYLMFYCQEIYNLEDEGKHKKELQGI